MWMGGVLRHNVHVNSATQKRFYVCYDLWCGASRWSTHQYSYFFTRLCWITMLKYLHSWDNLCFPVIAARAQLKLLWFYTRKPHPHTENWNIYASAPPSQLQSVKLLVCASAVAVPIVWHLTQRGCCHGMCNKYTRCYHLIFHFSHTCHCTAVHLKGVPEPLTERVIMDADELRWIPFTKLHTNVGVSCNANQAHYDVGTHGWRAFIIVHIR